MVLSVAAPALAFPFPPGYSMPMNKDALLKFLRDSGCLVQFENRAWKECLISHEEERWVGRGATQDDALLDAVRAMAPAVVIRALLEERVGNTAVGAAPAPSLKPVAAEPTSTVRTRPAPTRAAEIPVRPRLVTIDPRDNTAHVSTGPDPDELRELVHSVRERLDDMQEEIEDALDDLSRMAPDRIRLALLGWIAAARAVGAEGHGDGEVERRVRDIASRLGQLAKQLWPGTVRALRLDAEPDGALQGQVRGAKTPTWKDVAVLAEKTLDDLLESQAGYGWFDRGTPAPSAMEAEIRMSHARRTIEGTLGHEPDPSVLPAETLHELATAAGELRWVRTVPEVDGAEWGRLMGALRRIARKVGSDGTVLRQHVDPNHAPQGGWRTWLTSKTKDARDEELLRQKPDAEENNEALWAWIRKGFDAVSVPELVELVGDLEERVLELEESDLPNPDRRYRRKLRELQRRLSAPDAEAEAEDDDDTELDAHPLPTDDSWALQSYVRPTAESRLRAKLAGQKTLFVSNRTDRELQQRLSDTLGLDLSWCDGSPRRVESAAGSIAEGSYELVMVATGFQSHSADGMLSRAAKKAGVPYVRVYKGRPQACVRALARTFGLDLDDPSSAAGG